MWTEVQKNGKVKFVERFINPITDKEQKVSVTLDNANRKNTKIANDMLNQKINKKLDALNLGLKDEKITLKDLCEVFVSTKKNTTKLSTYHRYDSMCNTFMKALGDDSIVNNLTSRYVSEKFLDYYDKKSSYNNIIRRFKTFIRWGYDNDYIENKKCIEKLLAVPDNESKKKLEEKYLEKEELELLLNAMPDCRYKLMVQFSALTGMRVGEIIALNENDVDFENKAIHVTKTFDYQDGRTVTSPKTFSSTRDVYMQPELETLCHKIVLEMKKQKLLFCCRSDLFLFGCNGQYIDYYTYNDFLKKYAKESLKKNIAITTHVMRHTHVALMAESGIPLDVIARRLGHENSEITQKIYFHVTKKLKERDDQLVARVNIL